MLDILDTLTLLLREHVSASTVVLAILAAGGALIHFIGLTSVKRVSLADEAARVAGVREPSPLDRLQTRLNQSGLHIRVLGFLAVGLLAGALAGAALFLLGFITLGLLALAGGPLAYYAFLMARRGKERRAFRDALPDAIDDCADQLETYRNVARALQELAVKGPQPLRSTFEGVLGLTQAGVPVQRALREAAASCEEVFLRQFLDALANAEAKGGDVKTVLERLAKAQRAQSRMQRRIAAAQAGGRLVGAVYGIAPAAFLVFMRLFGGETYGTFYPSALGQAVQALVVLSGALTWWATRKIALRGIYLDEQVGARLETATRSSQDGGGGAKEPGL